MQEDYPTRPNSGGRKPKMRPGGAAKCILDTWGLVHYRVSV